MFNLQSLALFYSRKDLGLMIPDPERHSGVLRTVFFRKMHHWREKKKNWISNSFTEESRLHRASR